MTHRQLQGDEQTAMNALQMLQANYGLQNNCTPLNNTPPNTIERTNFQQHPQHRLLLKEGGGTNITVLQHSSATSKQPASSLTSVSNVENKLSVNETTQRKYVQQQQQQLQRRDSLVSVGEFFKTLDQLNDVVGEADVNTGVQDNTGLTTMTMMTHEQQRKPQTEEEPSPPSTTTQAPTPRTKKHALLEKQRLHACTLSSVGLLRTFQRSSTDDADGKNESYILVPLPDQTKYQQQWMRQPSDTLTLEQREHLKISFRKSAKTKMKQQAKMFCRSNSPVEELQRGSLVYVYQELLERLNPMNPKLCLSLIHI